MKSAVAKETSPGERRVALVPDAVATLVKAGLEVLVEAGAGERAYFSDSDYQKSGATIVDRPERVFGDADVVAKVQGPSADEAKMIRQGAVIVSFLQPVQNLDAVRALTKRKVSAFSMDLVPRISRAQSMDALSSQATASGYKAVLIAALSLSKFFPMLTTAAGTIFAAQVLVLGAGGAGVQGVATARRLGAVVWGYDVR